MTSRLHSCNTLKGGCAMVVPTRVNLAEMRAKVEVRSSVLEFANIMAFPPPPQ